jgi:hypothetical protein
MHSTTVGKKKKKLKIKSAQVIYLHRSQLAKYLRLCTTVSKTTAVNIMSRKYASI